MIITVTAFFKIKNTDFFNGKDGYIQQQLEFDTHKDKQDIGDISELSEILRDEIAKSLNISKNNVVEVSADEYKQNKYGKYIN